MKSPGRGSRRDFPGVSSAALAAANRLSAGEPKDVANPPSRLALHGGPKSVLETPPKRVRWGEPERERLSAMLAQDSLFYWRGPQTTLLIDRFKKTCPLRDVMTCSSGTAALHIAAAAAGVGPGDEVVTSPITDIGTVIGALYQQAVPVFADLGRNTFFPKHGFFAGRWPVKELALTSMDYTKVSCPEAESILKTCIRVVIHDQMSEGYVRSVAAAIGKVASHYREEG